MRTRSEIKRTTVMAGGTLEDAEELIRLNDATDETLSDWGMGCAFKDTPAAKQAIYLLRKWRELAMKPRK